MTILLELRELAAKGDERAVKRAYASALKRTRPEDDPVGFQHLHDAYQHALALCRAVQEDADVVPMAMHDTPTPIPASADDAPPPVRAPLNIAAKDMLPPQPDPADAAAALLKEGSTAVIAYFPKWIREHSREWSLDTRDAVGRQVLHALRTDQVAMNAENLDRLYQLFGWDDVSGGLDPRHWHWLAQRAQQAWLQLPAQQTGLSALVAGDTVSRPSPRQLQGALQSLRTPRSRLRNLFTALHPERARRIVALMNVLGCHPDVPLPPGIDGGQAAFWANQSVPSHPLALQVGLMRSAVFSLVILGIILFAVWAEGLSQVPTWEAVLGSIGAVLIPPALVAVGYGKRALYLWQMAAEDMPVRYPWLRALGVPLLILALGGLLPLIEPAGPLVFGALWILSWQVLRIAQLRWCARRGVAAASGTLWLFFTVAASMLVVPALVAALVYWGMDLFRHRRQMRWTNR